MACFYILPRLAGQQPTNQCYRAVYLMQRTVCDLVRSIADKLDLQANMIQRALYVNPKGLHIMIDDDVVRQLSEGQDMSLELTELNDYHEFTTVKREWDLSDTPSIDGHAGNEQRPTVRYELKVLF